MSNNQLPLKVKIFVSHRIDIDSEILSSQIFVPMRCGAVFDDRSYHIQGDDTGDNISEKRMSYCEFTVQYWSWKNTEADYYGLCHYRRYFSFSKKRYKTFDTNMIRESRLTKREIKKYHLNNDLKLCGEISQYELIVPEPASVEKMSYKQKPVNTLREMWESYNGIYFEDGILDTMFRLIKERFPQYYESACRYFNGKKHRAFNCYIMKKELFFRMCEFQFDIMGEMDKIYNSANYQNGMKRCIGYVGEILNGIFIDYLINVEGRKYKERQLVFFVKTDRIKSKKEYYKYRISSFFDRTARLIVDPILPVNSKKREKIKKVLFKITPLKPQYADKPITEKIEKNKE